MLEEYDDDEESEWKEPPRTLYDRDAQISPKTTENKAGRVYEESKFK